MADKFRTVYMVASRPERIPLKARTSKRDKPGQKIPEGWRIFNAPRPIYGHLAWTSPEDYAVGWFWAAVDPEGDYADEYLKRNLQLDALEPVWISEQEIRQVVKDYQQEHYPDSRVDIDSQPLHSIWDIFVRVMEGEED